jgi:hypothetical protein
MYVQACSLSTALVQTCSAISYQLYISIHLLTATKAAFIQLIEPQTDTLVVLLLLNSYTVSIHIPYC